PSYVPSRLRASVPFLIAQQLQKARLRPRRAANTAQGKPALQPIDLLQISDEIPRPKRRAFAERRELRRLVVRPAQTGQVAIALCKVRQRDHRIEQPLAQKP